MDQTIDSAAYQIDGLKCLHLEILKPLILALELPDLSELLVEFFVIGVEDCGLEGQSRAANREDAYRQYLFHDKHFPTMVINSS